MDDLDRLYFELVETLRRERPGRLEEPLTVLELTEDVIPYPRVRTPVGFRSNGDYEATISRLLSGERGYVATDSSEMRDAIREGLEERIPDVRVFRSFPDVRVRLSPERIPPPGDIRYAPPELQERAMREEEARVPEAEAGGTAPESAEDEGSGGDGDPGDGSGGPDRPGVTDIRVRPPEDEPGDEMAGRCPGCDAGLPDRPIRYCPHCGVPVRAAGCEVCGTDLEPGWRFCVECGTPRNRALEG